MCVCIYVCLYIYVCVCVCVCNFSFYRLFIQTKISSRPGIKYLIKLEKKTQ